MGEFMALGRIDWAVAVVAPKPSDQLLEIGCGHGVAVTKVCERLVDGGIVAIDRSATMVAAAMRRNALDHRRFDKVFAIRVGVFTRGDPTREFAALVRLLKPEGRLFLFHDEPSTGADEVGARIEAAVLRHRWNVEARSTHVFDGGEVACVIARPPS
ncbi:hypothetical protein N183_13285 [Sinorhizobium sp. Sb3]|uniref:methyltransferase domain-containing protein n=1 Tax=Sinorhizobium sp. Sb3 TaxID=1358417 RepID=UPI0007256B9A|nr:class I SAM-dependent methyltransferase [Sinorhizobium sp. Sb3]KSV83526.1 hypothetical protein N183_13285 [Sinorhizobium sp. Sb3]